MRDDNLLACLEIRTEQSVRFLSMIFFVSEIQHSSKTCHLNKNTRGQTTVRERSELPAFYGTKYLEAGWLQRGVCMTHSTDLSWFLAATWLYCVPSGCVSSCPPDLGFTLDCSGLGLLTLCGQMWQPLWIQAVDTCCQHSPFQTPAPGLVLRRLVCFHH